MLGRSMWKNHCNVFNVYIKYVRNYIQKHFKMGILKYAQLIIDVFKMEKLIPPPIRKKYEYHESA